MINKFPFIVIYPVYLMSKMPFKNQPLSQSFFHFLLVLGLTFSSSIVQAQNASVTAKVQSEQEAILFATAVLKAAADSSVVKAEVTDEHGIFTIKGLAAGSYWLSISYVGKQPYQSEVFTLAAAQALALPTIELQAADTELETQVVTAVRPIVEVKPDKTVFNVDGSINATGNDGLELLRKAPGVVVDNNDNINLAGKSGVQVYIDGKPSPLSGEDLANYLKSVDSSNIDNIEIITNPSAKYDAEGNAGIINIRMKKDKRHGSNTSINLGYSIGNRPKYNGGISTNYRNKLVNVFGNYSYNHTEHWHFMDFFRQQSNTEFDQYTLTLGNTKNHYYKAGADFFVGPKSTVGFIFNGYNTNSDKASDSETFISQMNASTIDSVLVAGTEKDDQYNNFNVNLNYQFEGNNGRTWNVDADYGLFRNRAYQYQPNFYKSADQTEILQERIFSNNAPTDIDIYTLKVDYEQPLAKGKLGVGAKTAFVQTNNVFDFFNINNGTTTLDETRSSRFEYLENVNAIYANYNQPINKFNAQIGLRVEQTNSKGDLTALVTTEDDLVERSYIDYFPSVGISYQVSPTNSLSLNYSRRLDRPSYQNLNPFESKLDELTFYRGNPFLRPQYTHNVQLVNTLFYRFTTTLGFSYTYDLMTRISDQEGDYSSFLSWFNLTEQYNYSLAFSAPISFTKWWSSYSNISAFHLRNQAAANDEIKEVDIAVTVFSLYSQQTFTLPYDFRFEVSGYYSSPSVWGGVFETDHNYSIEIGLQKKLFNKKGNLKVAMGDVFNTAPWRGGSTYGNIVLKGRGGYDSQRLKINFSYNFGNQNVKSRKRKTGIEEENKRAK